MMTPRSFDQEFILDPIGAFTVEPPRLQFATASDFRTQTFEYSIQYKNVHDDDGTAASVVSAYSSRYTESLCMKLGFTHPRRGSPMGGLFTRPAFALPHGDSET